LIYHRNKTGFLLSIKKNTKKATKSISHAASKAAEAASKAARKAARNQKMQQKLRQNIQQLPCENDKIACKTALTAAKGGLVWGKDRHTTREINGETYLAFMGRTGKVPCMCWNKR
jgi:hypothetical protein